MASFVLQVRAKQGHRGASALGLALALTINLPGRDGPIADAASGHASPQGEPAIVRLAAADDGRLPGLEPRVAAEKPAPTTNAEPTNGTAGKLDLTETLSPAFQAKTNTPADWSQFQEALDDLRRQIEADTARNAQAIATGLSVIEPTLIRHQAEGLDMVRRLNQTTRLAVGSLVVVMLIGLFAAVFMLLRGMNRFVEVLAAARPPGTLGVGQAVVPLNAGPVEQATARFLGAIDRLEHRIQGLERTAQHHLADAERKQPLDKPPGPERPAADRTEAGEPGPGNVPWPARPPARVSSHASVLVGKGATLLHLGQTEEALRCFDEALASDPRHAEAWIKKGLALEQMERLEEALASYDQALALDSSITAAYLHKGGVCNQLERYTEALDCYEKALHTERKPPPVKTPWPG